MTSSRKFAKALNDTLNHFKIRASKVSAESGVTEASISRFRRYEHEQWRDIQVESLEKILSALPLEAQQFFVFNCLLGDLDANAMSLLLSAIAMKLRANPATPELEKISA